MRLLRSLLIFVFCLGFLPTLSLFSQDGERKTVYHKADETRPLRITDDSSAINLRGKVVLYHEGAIITCDSAVRYSDRYMKCYGNVVINKDSTYIYGNSADYNGEEHTAKVYAPIIKMVDGGATLYTYALSFNTKTSIASFTVSGTMRHSDNLLESSAGYFHTRTRDFICVHEVQMSSPEYKLVSDSVKYNLDTEIATILAETTIWNDKGEILYATSGTYNTKESDYRFTKDSYILTDVQEMWSDTLNYNSVSENAELFNNIQLHDTEHSVIGFGDHGLYWGKSQDAQFSRNPSIIYYDKESESDSLYMRADSIFLLSADRFAATAAMAEEATRLSNPGERPRGGRLRTVAAPVDSLVFSADSLAAPVDSLVVSADSPAAVVDSLVVSADSLAAVVDSLAFSADSPAAVVDSLAFSADSPAAVVDSLVFSADSPAAVVDSLVFSADSPAAVVDSLVFSADSPAAVVDSLVVSADSPAAVVDSLAFSADSPAAVVDSLAFSADSPAAVVDSLAFSADSPAIENPAVESAPQDSTYRILRAYRDVKFFRSDFQGICDSLYGNSIDSTIHMRIEPVMWSGVNQIKSDEVDIHTRNEMLDKAIFSQGVPMMSSEVDSVRYNQVKGKQITAFFTDNDITRTDVVGNAQTKYYVTDEQTGDVQGLWDIESADLTFFIEKQAVEDIIWRGSPIYSLYPIEMVPPDMEVILPGFVWDIARKPALADIFTRSIRPSRRSHFESLTQPIFPRTDAIHKYIGLVIESGTWSERNDQVTNETREVIRRFDYEFPHDGGGK